MIRPDSWSTQATDTRTHIPHASAHHSPSPPPPTAQVDLSLPIHTFASILHNWPYHKEGMDLSCTLLHLPRFDSAPCTCETTCVCVTVCACAQGCVCPPPTLEGEVGREAMQRNGAQSGRGHSETPLGETDDGRGTVPVTHTHTARASYCQCAGQEGCQCQRVHMCRCMHVCKCTHTQAYNPQRYAGLPPVVRQQFRQYL